MADEQKYLVRDRQGNVFGPADAQMLRAWVAQGRIVAGMAIGPRETREWIEASVHPLVADLLHDRPADTAQARSMVPAPPEAADPPEAVVTRRAPAETALDYSNAPTASPLALLSFFLGAMTGVGTCASCLPWLNTLAVPVTGLMALGAITLGALANWQMNAAPGRYRGRALAILGVMMGIVALLAVFVIVVIRTVWQRYF